MQIEPTQNFSQTGSNAIAAPSTTRSSHHANEPSFGQAAHGSQAQAGARNVAAHEALREHVLASDYPCVMARSAFIRGTYHVRTYAQLGATDNAASLCHDLYAFSADFPAPVDGAVSFIACFGGPSEPDEQSFEQALWRQLQAVHEVDRTRFKWAADVDSAPQSSEFSFSVGARAFFLIGMHPAASRTARRTPMPMVVFNLHEQFVELRANGKFDGVRDKIQRRDKQLQGTINPMSADFGARSEAAQYSGRNVGPEWVCPFAHQ
jgi:uncharacterized protein